MKTKSILQVTLVSLASLLCACDYEYEPDVVPDDPAIPRTGKVIGTGRVVYSGIPNAPGGKVTCVDDTATFEMKVAKDDTVPEGSWLTKPMLQGEPYFRLDIHAVLRILDKGACIERDPSDDRMQLRVEGGVKTAFRPIISCSKSVQSSRSNISFTGEWIVSGTVECIYSDQMKYTFEFSGLKLL